MESDTNQGAGAAGVARVVGMHACRMGEGGLSDTQPADPGGQADPALGRHSITFVLSPPVDNLSSASPRHECRRAQNASAVQYAGISLVLRASAHQAERTPRPACTSRGPRQSAAQGSQEQETENHQPNTARGQASSAAHLQLRHDGLAQQGGVVHHRQSGDQCQVAPLVARHGAHVALQGRRLTAQ